MRGYADLIEVCHKIKYENNLNNEEVAKELEEVADRYRRKRQHKERELQRRRKEFKELLKDPVCRDRFVDLIVDVIQKEDSYARISDYRRMEND